MNLLDEYRRNAQECQRMANNAGNPADKASWLRLAASWLSMIRNDSRRFIADDGGDRQRADEGSAREQRWPVASDEDSKASH